MADRPVIFSTAMVRALLSGSKSMTRRVIKPHGFANLFYGEWTDSYVLAPGNESWRQKHVRYAVGDRLWVREAWRCNGWATDVATIMYRASEHDGYTAMTEQYPVAGKRPVRVTGAWRPSIHMPRWASRLTLTVTEVKVERLQEISEDDAVAEGVKPVQRPGMSDGVYGLYECWLPDGKRHFDDSAYRLFAKLWNSLHGRGAWDANPLVQAPRFTVEHRNIDEAPHG